MTRLPLLTLAFVAVLSCSDGRPVAEQSSLRTCAQPLIAAQRDDAEPYQYPFVGVLRIDEQGADGAVQEVACTATLVSCGAAITSAHCVAAQDRTLRGAGVIDASSRSSPQGLTGAPYDAQVVGVFVHPEYQPQRRGDAPDPDNLRRDVAVLALRHENANVSAEEAQSIKRRKRGLPYASLAAEPAWAGQDAVTVGYGIPERLRGGACAYDDDEVEPCGGPFCEPVHIVHRRFAFTPISNVRSVDPLAPIAYVADGTCPMPAPGDSGAPLMDGANRAVVGVLSGTNASSSSRCSATAAFYVNLTAPPLRAWLDAVLASLDEDGNGTPDACDVVEGITVKPTRDDGITPR